MTESCGVMPPNPDAEGWHCLWLGETPAVLRWCPVDQEWQLTGRAGATPSALAANGWRYVCPASDLDRLRALDLDRLRALTEFARRALPVMNRLARQRIFFDDLDDPQEIVCDFLAQIGADPDAPAEEALPLLGAAPWP